MTSPTPRRTPIGGGILIAAGVLGGAVFGISTGQPTVGVLGGTALGVALAALLWAVDKLRGA